MSTPAQPKSINGLFRWGHFLSRRYQIILDGIVLSGAFLVAYLARFEFQVPANQMPSLLAALPLAVLVQFLCLYFTGAYSFIWRYTGIYEVKGFIKTGLWSLAILLALRLVLPNDFQSWRVPLSVIFMDTFLAISGTLSLRVLRRWVFEVYEKDRTAPLAAGGSLKPTLLVGAGRGGSLALKEISVRGDMGLKVLGFVDDDPQKQGMKVQGTKVLGTTRDIPKLVRNLGIEEVVITIDNASRDFFVRLLDICQGNGVKVRVIPGLYQLLQGNYKISRIRDVDIEDLLGREVIQLDEEAIGRYIAGRRVMVTGAGGSIGSEMARQVAQFGPEKLLLVERAEFALFEIDRELRGAFPESVILPLVADINDELRLESLFGLHRPEVIFHAAAHKHVPLMEHNPSEAVKNNCLGTRILGEMAGRFGVETFVFISTDKAVNPTSVMGASKRMGELVIQDLNRRYDTRFLAVRFGNVLGSTGSVIPVFRDQILKGGPVTITHPDMIRYFMTIPEAAQLVLQAGTISRGGEIFVLDMGRPVKILDLAEEMIKLSGLKPYENIEITFTGIRPGEKLFEELGYNEEIMDRTGHPKIYIGKMNGLRSREETGEIMKNLAFLSQNGHYRELREYLNSVLPEANVSPDNPGQPDARAESLNQSAG
jgi:FlaA1/EpsC-like NDP-sugar epimerase